MANQALTTSDTVPPVSRQRVLVVDDETSILFAYSKLLGSQGYCVDTCENFSDAIALIGTFTYLSVISDMRLEGTGNEDGIKLMHFTREMQPEARIIVVTGYGTAELKNEVKRLGAAYYFEKPICPSIIMTALQTLGNTAHSSADQATTV